MPEQYGAEQYGTDVFGGKLRRIINQKLITFFPQIMPREEDSTFYKYLDAHDEQFDGYEGGISYVKLSHQVNNAQGPDLRRIGSIFGPLGEQGSRTENEYAAYLSTLIQSFNARGTLSGLRFAIAAAVNIDESNVTIIEDFENNEYEIELRNITSGVISSVVNDLAELADPSGVELATEPIIITAGDSINLTATQSSVIETTDGLGSGEVTFDGQNTLN